VSVIIIIIIQFTTTCKDDSGLRQAKVNERVLGVADCVVRRDNNVRTTRDEKVMTDELFVARF